MEKMKERKAKRSRAPRKVFLVICEGETEKVYVEMLQRYYHLPIAIRTKIAGGDVTQRLISKWKAELEDGLGSIEVFHVYDTDVKAVLDKLAQLEGTPILTTPCIELWFLLHVLDWKRSFRQSADALKALKNSAVCWRNYQKATLSLDQQKWLQAHQQEAVERASRLKYPGNPSSNFPAFIERLEREKKRGGV